MIRPTPKTCEVEGCKREPVHRCANCYRWICEKHTDSSGYYPILCPECAKIPMSKYESETVITISKASPYARVYSQEKAWIKKLTNHKHGELLKEYRDSKGRVYAYEFIVDKNCISLSKKPRSRYDKL